jgi:hypothetical protein
MVTSSQGAKPDDSVVVKPRRSVNRGFVSVDPERQPEVPDESDKLTRKKGRQAPTGVGGAGAVPAKGSR